MLDFLVRFALEDAVLLAPAELIALAIALGIHRRRMTQGSRRGVYVTILACGVLLVIQYLVDTPREKLAALIRDLVRAVDDGDMEVIAAAFDEGGVALGAGAEDYYDKPLYVQGVRVGLQRYQVDNAKLGALRIELADGGAAVSFRVNCDLRGAEGFAHHTMSAWVVHAVRRPEGWRIDRVVSAKLGLGSLGSSISVLGYLKDFCREASGPLPVRR